MNNALELRDFIAGSTWDLLVVAGPIGSGKTHCVETMTELWRAGAVYPSGGDEGTTVLLNDEKIPAWFKAGGIVVLDEVGRFQRIAGDGAVQNLFEAAARSGTKVVLIVQSAEEVDRLAYLCPVCLRWENGSEHNYLDFLVGNLRDSGYGDGKMEPLTPEILTEGDPG